MPASLFGLTSWRLWKTLIIPAIFPFWVTGAVTATGGRVEREHRGEGHQLGPEPGRLRIRELCRERFVCLVARQYKGGEATDVREVY